MPKLWSTYDLLEICDLLVAFLEKANYLIMISVISSWNLYFADKFLSSEQLVS